MPIQNINIISREVIPPVGFFPAIWKFDISPSDAQDIIDNHYGLKLDTLSGIKAPSLQSAPWSEIYSGATSDPYPFVWNVVEDGVGSDDWSINFLVESGNTIFSDIDDWNDFTLFIEVQVVNAIDIRVRSPYLLISSADTATTFTNTSYIIKQYEDEIDTYPTQPISYSKSKSKIVNNQNNIWINISNLVKEDLESDVSYYKDTDYTIARNLSLNESKWVYINTSLSYLSTVVLSGETFYFITDGYIEPTETQGLPNVLMTGNKRYMYKGSNERIYFKTNNLTGATYTTSENPTPTNITFSGDLTYNYGYVKSVKVDNSDLNIEWASYNFNYASAATQNVTVYFYDECKYDNYDLVFKNKYGVLETLSMSKKSSKAININSTDYLRSIVDYEGDFNINRHTSKQFNVSGNEEWILNTDFLPEYMNQPIKEAMLTEEMWLIDAAGNITPVIKLDSSLSFKTSLNDKMIQYTVRVKQSHNTVNNII